MPRHKEPGDISGNAEAIAEAVQKTREMAAARAGSVPATKQPSEPVTVLNRGFFPTDENEQEFFDAQRHLEAHRAAEQKRREEQEAEERREFRYALRCREWSTHPKDMPTHGIYFKEMPTGDVGDKDWFAGYKPLDSVWRNQIVCQVCLRLGKESPLPIEYVNYRQGTFRIDNKWLIRIPTDPERARIEGEIRAVDIPGDSNNWHRREAMQRWKDYCAAKKTTSEVTSG